MKSQCVPKANQMEQMVDGQWGQWQGWSACSRTCGGGIRRSIRACDSPAPSAGGLYCVGDRVRYTSCQTAECPRGSDDFRQEQCRRFDGNSFNIEGVPSDVKWLPKYTGSKLINYLLSILIKRILYLFTFFKVRDADKCKLFCRIQHSSAYYLLDSVVADGTPCGADTFHKCVNGQCIPAGCDHVLGSGKTLGK